MSNKSTGTFSCLVLDGFVCVCEAFALLNRPAWSLHGHSVAFGHRFKPDSAQSLSIAQCEREKKQVKLEIGVTSQLARLQCQWNQFGQQAELSHPKYPVQLKTTKSMPRGAQIARRVLLETSRSLHWSALLQSASATSRQMGRELERSCEMAADSAFNLRGPHQESTGASFFSFCHQLVN